MPSSTHEARLDSHQITLAEVPAIDTYLAAAFARGASDLQVERDSSGVRITERIHGKLLLRERLPAPIHRAFIARLKVLAGLRTDEHTIAQDGSFALDDDGRFVRVSLIPARLGERASLRLIDGSQAPATLQKLGVPTPLCESLQSIISCGNGMLLVAGATGSGKSSTQRALLGHCAAQGSCVVSLEDPIEFAVPGVTHIPITPLFGFSQALRSVLRHDPDVIAIGEIRDPESATLASHAALTGHLVLATVHASSVDAALERIIGLGVSANALTESLRGVLYQRLEPIPCRSHRASVSCRHCAGVGIVGRSAHFVWKSLGVFSV